MDDLAAPDDTWGISGPVFLVGYLVLAAVSVWITVLARRGAVAGSAGPAAPTELDPFALALLAGGEVRALQAALAGLRARDLITSRGSGKLAAQRPLPRGVHPLEAAVHRAIGKGPTKASKLLGDERVRSALAPLRPRLEGAGLVPTGPQKAARRAAALLLVPVFALGVFRFVAGVANDKPVTYLVIVLGVLAVVELVFLVGRTPARTKAGDKVLLQHTGRHEHLEPSLNPSWQTYGASGAALGVALFGAGALIAADPAFAAEAGIRQIAASSASSYTDTGSSCSSSSCSGGSSCGGGGGCGG
jgi:uncharacterized protein (TIGR04222 family)